MQRVPATPLITNDPYFSAWSPSDTLYGAPVVHWSNAPHNMNGVCIIDGDAYRFMGIEGAEKTMVQTDLKITATSSKYSFESDGRISLSVEFTSPLLLYDLELVSRPVTYVDFAVCSTDGAVHEVEIIWDMDESFCHNPEENQPMLGGVHKLSVDCAWMGLKKQTPLGHSGDGVRINWGYLYLCGLDSSKSSVAVEYLSALSARFENRAPKAALCAKIKFQELHQKPETAFLVLGYDDMQAINYFGNFRKALWADDTELYGVGFNDPILQKNRNALSMLQDAINEHDAIKIRSALFDEQLEKDAQKVGGEEYARLCGLAYRQSIAAHKLIKDSEGKVIFLSKECYSNGCIGTVDVSYPSTPLYLLYNPELVMGMARPVVKYAQMPAWPYDFAPHDVGRYPHVTGQVYSLKDYQGVENGDVFPPYYTYPASSVLYDIKHQMPVEECGNMLIMIAAVATLDGNIYEFGQDMPLLEKWAGYLVKHGDDPGEQLCTDDFAGRLAHNVNLSVKAILGVASMGIIKNHYGRPDEGQAFIEKAREMARAWEAKFENLDHTPLTFNNLDSWGLKYNLIWDLIFGLNLFSEKVYKREISVYLEKQNKYGVPLDNRADYTKSDWILWCAAMTLDLEERKKLIAPICRFLEETPDRVPFSDWYDTKNSVHYHFQNRTVQGGLFMPLLRAKSLKNI